MATALGAVRRVIGQVRAAGDHGDGELLRRWNRERDEAAFGTLVERHGPMVLGVCRRVLGDPHAAEDAFQVTFLVLAKKADAVRPPGVLGPWLHGVAYRTALKARGRAFRRRQVEQDYAEQKQLPGTHVPGLASTDDLRPVIDEQVNALPEKYRLPLVLCAVQGRGKAEAAERLGLPEGTVSSRLARAREMLRDRLTRRGVIVPAAALAAFLVPNSLRAAVPPGLSASAAAATTGSAAVAAPVLELTREVMSAMTLAKFKLLAAVAFAVAITAGGMSVYAVKADDKKPAAGKPANPADKPAKPTGDKPDKPKPPVADPTKPKPEKPAGDKAAPGKFAGQIEAVDAKARTITLTIKGDGGVTDRVFKVAPGAKVFVDGKEAKLGGVPKGAFASVVPAGQEGTEASEVRVTGPNLVGVVTRVDGSSLTIEVPGKPGPTAKTVKLTADTHFLTGDKKAMPAAIKAGDVKAGDRVHVSLTADESAALSVGIAPPEGAKKPGKFVGAVVAVDPAARTISLAGKGGNEVVVKLTADAKVTVDGKAAKLADVPKGSTAAFTITSKDGGSPEAAEVTVTGPTLVGIVKQVDAGSITISAKGDRTIKLLPSTKVVVAGKDAKPADVKVGDKITVTLSADESAALLITDGPRGDAPNVKPKPEKIGDKKPEAGEPKPQKPEGDGQPGEKPKPGKGEPKPDGEKKPEKGGEE